MIRQKEPFRYKTRLETPSGNLIDTSFYTKMLAQKKGFHQISPQRNSFLMSIRCYNRTDGWICITFCIVNHYLDTPSNCRNVMEYVMYCSGTAHIITFTNFLSSSCVLIFWILYLTMITLHDWLSFWLVVLLLITHSETPWE